MQQSADIVDLASYRKSRQPDQTVQAESPRLPVAWMPVWVMVPMPIFAPGSPT